MPAVLNPEHKLPRPDHPELMQTICFGMASGLSYRAIAGHCGISKLTLEAWVSDGRAEVARYDSGEQQELGSVGVLAQGIERAYAAFEIRKVIRVDAGGPDWVSALAHVTRRNPQDWAERRYEHVQQDIRTVSVSVALTSLPEQQLLALVRDKLDQGTALLPPPPGSQEIEPHGGSEAETTPAP